MQPLILDTTYILPFFGIEVKKLKGAAETELRLLFERGHADYALKLPSVCLIETTWKLLHEYRKQQDESILRRYEVTLPTFKALAHLEIVHPVLLSKACQIAASLYCAGHRDYMDCWIAGTAYALDCTLLTEDDHLTTLISALGEEPFPTLDWDGFRKTFQKKENR